MMRPHFKEIICVYMYIIPNLEHINKYINWAQNKYNVKFIETIHYALPSYIKNGTLGIKQNKNTKTYNLNKIDEFIRTKTGAEWSFYGFKQSDGLNRRLMLQTYTGDCISEKSKKAYPLSEWKNKDILAYINQNDLIHPIDYGVKSISTGTSIDDIDFLLWTQKYHPNDLKKIIDIFPFVEQKIFEYEYQQRKKEEL